MIPAFEPEVVVLPISILSSDNKHSDDFTHAPLCRVSGAEIAYLFREASNSDMRFKNLKKKATLTTDPFAPISQVLRKHLF